MIFTTPTISCNHCNQAFETFSFSFLNSSTASLNASNILITSKAIAIVEREAPSLFFNPPHYTVTAFSCA